MQFLEGWLWGASTMFIVGPVFFTLLKGALQGGVRSGTAVAVGIVFSDILVAFLCYAGFAAFVTKIENQFWIGIAGAAILTGLGIKYLLQRAIDETGQTHKSKSWGKYFSSGFLVNFVNPAVFAIWLGLIAYSRTKFGTEKGVLLFLGGVLAGVFSIDMTKVFLAHFIRKLLKPYILSVVYKVIGCLLIVFAGVIIWNIL